MAEIYIDLYHSGMYQRMVRCEQGENLYEVLTRYAITLPGAVCRGAGVCRGCMVYIAEEGMEYPACRYTVETEELHVILNRRMDRQSILLLGEVQNASEPENPLEHPDKRSEEHPNGTEGMVSLGIAFDIGTTTIASALVNLKDGQILEQTGCLNRQAEFGADVVSRIQYACTPETGMGDTASGRGSGLEQMHQCIRSDIEGLLQFYLGKGYEKRQIRRLVFSGNTTMIHFLLGLSVQGMAAYPFTPERLTGCWYLYGDMEVLILPSKSAFVGGDIVSGVRYLELGKGASYELLIDLGTNGELWLLNQDRGVCTSTSCGPAFANSVTRGSIYGTTLIDGLARSYREGKLDADGLLQGAYFDQGIALGEVVITQDTVRQIQLAKAAIRTGIELAAYELRLPLEDIAHVYLAGGFGFHLDLESAYTIGLFPEEFRSKVTLAGNTSLAGAIGALQAQDTAELLRLDPVLEESTVMDLSMNKNFQEFFLHRIGFPAE